MSQVTDLEDIRTTIREMWTGAGNVPGGPHPADPWSVPLLSGGNLGDLYVAMWTKTYGCTGGPEAVFIDIRKNWGGDDFLAAQRKSLGI